MAGTDPIAEAEAVGDADALFVLTAALLTPARFPSVLGDDYPAACAALGLEPYEEGYGLVFGQDGLGARWTVVVDDVSLVAVAISSWDCGMAYDLSPDENAVVAGLPGWPLAVATRAPGVPEPHDPEPEEGDPAPLVAPSGEAWGPAQRRLGADEVALRWAAWRAQVGDGDAAVGDAGEAAGPEAEPAPAPSAHSPQSPQSPQSAAPSPGPARDPYVGVREALEQLRGYVEEPPPVGRVRSVAGAEGGARTLRADGPGWSLVARADDMAFVLLDEFPGEVLPVSPGPHLPALLKALDAMAVRPS
ncbi:hypothetical protein DEJ45_00975 [Streptomyces venezuelae]|uniref:hypothetical protein n=1 Tax=Streptomyces venezuelae TaxID=54571 RepID=UPI00123D559E|nr:hypothetical protein [Streptomyces venezuelae]QES11142.1 hypothetical protein DEJ45_00975 [Streptomyces venezuelae]